MTQEKARQDFEQLIVANGFTEAAKQTVHQARPSGAEVLRTFIMRIVVMDTMPGKRAMASKSRSRTRSLAKTKQTKTKGKRHSRRIDYAVS